MSRRAREMKCWYDQISCFIHNITVSVTFKRRRKSLFWSYHRPTITLKDKCAHNDKCVNLMDRMGIQRRWRLAAWHDSDLNDFCRHSPSAGSHDPRSDLIHTAMNDNECLWRAKRNVAPNPPRSPPSPPTLISPGYLTWHATQRFGRERNDFYCPFE